MLKGIVERRIAPRVPFSVDLKLRLEKEGHTVAFATANDISVGGIQFSVPVRFATDMVGEVAEFVFDLPRVGKIAVRGKVMHQRYGLDERQNQVAFYGVKFVDVDPSSWNHIAAYCEARAKSGEDNGAESKIDTTMRNSPLAPLQRKNSKGSSHVATLVLRTSRTIRGYIDDINFGGLQMRIPEHIPSGSLLTVRLPLKGGESEYRGTCAWCHPLAEDSDEFVIGVRLVVMDKDRLESLREFVMAYNGNGQEAQGG